MAETTRATTNALDDAYAALESDSAFVQSLIGFFRGTHKRKTGPEGVELGRIWADRIEAQERNRKDVRERLGAIIAQRDAELKQGKRQ